MKGTEPIRVCLLHVYERVSETIKSISAYKHADTVISTVNNTQSLIPGDWDEISPFLSLSLLGKKREWSDTS